MLVNRRTKSGENRNITVSFNNSVFCNITDVSSGKQWIIGANGTFTDNFSPGEGKLYKISAMTYNWSGNITVMNTVSVPSGTALNISAGTSLSFASGTSLTVYGTLSAVGKSSNPITFTRNGSTGNWGSIVISGSRANNSTISYADILYGTQIDVLSAINVSIQNCNISNFTGQGINFYGSTGSASYNTITSDNIYHGIVIQNGTVNCTENRVTKTTPNYRRGVGIFYGGGSGGFVRLNDVQGWNWGICAIWGGSPSSLSNYYLEKNNRVRNCDYGLMVYRSSYPIFGTPPPSDYMWNSIYDNTYNVSVGISYPTYSSGLYAYGCWWGNNPPNTSKFIVGTNSWFYYTPYLQSAPIWNNNLQQSVIASIENNAEEYSFQKSTQSSVNALLTANTFAEQPIENADVSSSDSFLAGVKLQGQNKHKEAVKLFRSLKKVSK